MLFVLLAVCFFRTAASANISASVRHDVWRSDLPEAKVPDPKDGRRVHVAITGIDGIGEDKDIGSVMVNGQEGLNLDTSDKADLKYFDWLRAHSNPATETLWVSFHTHNTAWLGDAVAVKVASKNSTVLFSGSANLVRSDKTLTLTYVAFRSHGAEVVLHVHNADSSAPHTLSALTFDGMSVTIPSQLHSLPPNAHAVLKAQLQSSKKATGEVWTATLVADAGAGMGVGGRADLNERLVVNGWPHSSDCSLPGGNDDNADQVKDAGINSIFYEGGNFHKNCGADLVGVLNKLGADNSSWFHALTDYKTAAALTPAAQASVVDALNVGDEVDGDIDAKHLRSALKKSLESTAAVPSVLTYQGSKTTRNVGSFAGITDIQGADAYCAACAPTMLPVVAKLPVSYPYDYLRNARDNHIPLPFWGYAQLYSDAWSYQANANELMAQLGQAVLSGSKGILFFQSYTKQFQEHRIKDITKLIKSISAVGKAIREGDVGGMTFTTSAELNKKVMIEVVRSPEQLLLVMVNIHATGYSNLVCHTGITDRHWTFHPLKVDSVTLNLASAPGVTSLSNWREAVGGDLVPLDTVTVKAEPGSVKVSSIDLSDNFPVRLFVADVKSSF